MKKILSTLLLCFSTTGNLYAQEPDWTLYAQLLDKYVSVKSYNGGTVHWVQYSQLKKDPLLNEVVKLVETFPVSQLADASEMLSFYINAYNILTINLVADKWPIKSIKDAGGFFVPVWHKQIGTLDQKEVSLHHLENNVLRKMKEPRIHFAVNCATVSSGNLRQEPYTAKKLDEQLTEQVIAFLNDPFKGIQKQGRELHVSKIFKWFKADFQSSGGPAQFIRKYYTIEKGQLVLADLTYNWSINGE